jgi:hypothetical protein
VEVEGHEEALLDVVVFCKLRPATPQVLFVVTIIPNLPDCSRRTASRSSRPSMNFVKLSGRR